MRFWQQRHRAADLHVQFVWGGEPLDGCDPVALLIASGEPEVAEARAHALGVWHASIVDDLKLKASEAALAAADSQGFVWRPADDRQWRGSDSWPGKMA